MRTSIALTPFVPWLLALASCTSPPKPPAVDESQKRPVNSQMAVELQVCKNDLQNTRLLATESSRIAETTAATLANLAARQQLLAAMQTPAAQRVEANSVFTVRFDFGSTRVAIPPDVMAIASSASSNERKNSSRRTVPRATNFIAFPISHARLYRHPPRHIQRLQ